MEVKAVLRTNPILYVLSFLCLGCNVLGLESADLRYFCFTQDSVPTQLRRCRTRLATLEDPYKTSNTAHSLST